MLRSRYQSWLLPYLEGSLDTEKKVLLEAQLARDPALLAEAEQLRQTVTALRASAADQEPLATSGFSVWPGVQARIQNQPQRSFGRIWALGGVCAAAAAGILFVTLSGHFSVAPDHSPYSVSKKHAAPVTQEASRMTDGKAAMPVPSVTNSAKSTIAPKMADKSVPIPFLPNAISGTKAASAPILPVPTNGKGMHDPFELPGQKTHPTMMAQLPKDEMRGQLPPLPVTMPPLAVSTQSAPEPFVSHRRDKNAVPLPPAPPGEFDTNRAMTHKDISAAPPASAGGFGGGGAVSAMQSKPVPPPMSTNGLDAGVAKSAGVPPPAPNKITIPIPAPSPVLPGQPEVRFANPLSADTPAPNDLATEQRMGIKSQHYSEPAIFGNVNSDVQQIETQLKNTMSTPLYGTADTEKKTTQLFAGLHFGGENVILRRNLLQERKSNPDDLETSRLLAALYAFQNDHDAALAERKRIVGLPGVTAEDWYQLAIAAQRKSDPSTARNAYFQVLQIGGLNNPDHYDQARQFFANSSSH